MQWGRIQRERAKPGRTPAMDLEPSVTRSAPLRLTAYQHSEQERIELLLAGAGSVRFWSNQLLTLANTAHFCGRKDIAAKLTCFMAELETDPVTELPVLKTVPGLPIYDDGLEDFTDISTVYLCKGLLNRAAVRKLGLPTVCYSLFSIKSVNDWLRDNQVQRVVLCAHNETTAAEMERLQAFIRIDSTLWRQP